MIPLLQMQLQRLWKICRTLRIVLLIAAALSTFLMVTRHMKQKTDVPPVTSSLDVKCGRGEKTGLPASSQTKLPPAIRLPSVCTNEACRADYVKYLQGEGEYPIPAIRHILWKGESVSWYFAEQLRSWHRIHPNWTYVLWRDRDLEPVVAAYYPGLLAKYKSLPQHIMRVDFFRYLLLFKYVGVYADLDYVLRSSLDQHRRFQAVVTREPDAHSLQFLGMSWPVKPVANPAFLMSAPGHIFMHYVIGHLENANAQSGSAVNYAGPFGLTRLLEGYTRVFPIANTAAETVYVPPSHSFYPYPGNRLKNSNSDTVGWRLQWLGVRCKALMESNKGKEQQFRIRSAQLTRYCTDVNNMDPITDSSQPVIAIHDLQKREGVWYGKGGYGLYTTNMTDMREALGKLKLGADFMRARG